MVTAGKIKAVRKETRAGTLLQRKIFYGNAQALYPKMPALRAR